MVICFLVEEYFLQVSIKMLYCKRGEKEQWLTRKRQGRRMMSIQRHIARRYTRERVRHEDSMIFVRLKTKPHGEWKRMAKRLRPGRSEDSNHYGHQKLHRKHVTTHHNNPPGRSNISRSRIPNVYVSPAPANSFPICPSFWDTSKLDMPSITTKLGLIQCKIPPHQKKVVDRIR